MADKPSFVQTPFGPVYTRGDQAYVRDKTGGIHTVHASDAARLLEEDGSPYEVASPEEVARRDIEIAHSSLAEKAKTGAESFAAGAADVPLIPIRLGIRGAHAVAKATGHELSPDALPNADRLTGRAFVEGLAHSDTGNESRDAAADEQYRQNAKDRRETNSGYATGGTLLGQAPYASLGPAAAAGKAVQGYGLGARLLGQVIGGAAEGAAYGESQATDDAYIENKPLTAEKLMASMGWGAVIGSGASLGLGAAGEAFGAAKSRASGALREGVDKDSAAAFNAARPEAPTAAATNPTEARIGAAADSAGANPVARREAAQQEVASVVKEAAKVDPTNWRQFTKEASPEAQYLHRDTVLNAASRETAQDLTNVLERQAPIYNEIDNLQAKRPKIAEHMAADGVDETTAIGRAQQETADLRERIMAMREQVQGKQGELANVGEQGPVAPRGAGKGRGKLKLSGAEEALNELDAIARDHQGRILNATTGADAAAEYDSLRRGLSKASRTIQGARPNGYAEGSMLDMIKPFAHDEYNRAAANLMDEGFVGKTQAAAQKAVNSARVDSIASGTYDMQPFVQQIAGRDAALYGRASYIGNQDSVRNMFAGLGQDGRSTRADQFARFVDNERKTLTAIRDNYSLSEGAAGKINESLASLDKMSESVDAATNAANKVNAAKARIEGDQIAGGFFPKLAASTVMGATQEGVTGAAKGFARGLLGGAGPTLELQQRLAGMSAESKLAAFLEGAVAKFSGTAGKGAAVANKTAASIDQKISQSLDSYFGKLATRGTKAALKAGLSAGDNAGQTEARARATSPGGPLASRAAIALFAGGDTPQVAYQKRTEGLLAASQNMGAGVRDATLRDMGGLAESAPRLAQHVAIARSNAVNYLLGHTPVPLRAPTVMQPGNRPKPSDLQVLTFAKRWAAVADPMTVLDDFRRGMVTYEQVDALKNVYPQMYQGIQMEALQRFQKLDAAGVPVPYDERLQANLMFDLHGAGDPTLDPGFALKVSGMLQKKQGQQQQRPHSKPINLAKYYAAPSQTIGATLRGTS